MERNESIFVISWLEKINIFFFIVLNGHLRNSFFEPIWINTKNNYFGTMMVRFCAKCIEKYNNMSLCPCSFFGNVMHYVMRFIMDVVIDFFWMVI